MLSDSQVQPHLQNRSWVDRCRPQWLRASRGVFQGQQHPWPGARLPAGPGYRRATGLPGRGNNRLVQLFGESDSIKVDTYFVYPEELKTVARVQVFRDFVVSKAQRWPS